MTESSSPNIKNKSHTITVDVEIPKDGADGVLVAAGGTVGGYALFVKDGKPTYEYNYFTVESLQDRRQGQADCPASHHDPHASSSTTAAGSARGAPSGCS